MFLCLVVKGPVIKGDAAFTAFTNDFKCQLHPLGERTADLSSGATAPDILLHWLVGFCSLFEIKNPCNNMASFIDIA